MDTAQSDVNFADAKQLGNLLLEQLDAMRVPYAIASLRRMLISLDPPEHLRQRMTPAPAVTS
jgi:hypothetical protein